MSVTNRFLACEAEYDTLSVFNHFDQDLDTAEVISTLTDTGTAAVGDEFGGVVTLTPSDGSVADNDEVYIQTANEVFLFGTGFPIYGRARFKWTETAAGIYNVAFGFMNAPIADSIIDNGGGVKVSGSTLAIYKVDGESVWRVASANNSVSTVTKSNLAAVGATYYEVEIFGADNGDGTMVVTFKVNGTYLKDANNIIIRHSVTMASSTEMAMFFGAKLGAATNNDTAKLDYWHGKQKAF